MCPDMFRGRTLLALGLDGFSLVVCAISRGLFQGTRCISGIYSMLCFLHVYLVSEYMCTWFRSNLTLGTDLRTDLRY